MRWHFEFNFLRQLDQIFDGFIDYQIFREVHQYIFKVQMKVSNVPGPQRTDRAYLLPAW
jgi:hypothetical protein